MSRLPLLVRRVLPLLLLGAAFWFLWSTVRHMGTSALADLLLDVEWGVFAAAFLANLLRYVVWASRWWLLLQPVSVVRWWPTFEALMASVFVNTVVPAARPFGGLVRARHLAARTGHPSGPLFGVALVDQAGYGLVSVALGAAILPLVVRDQIAHRAGQAGLALAAIAILVLLLVPLWRRRRRLAGPIERRLPGTLRALSGTLGVLRRTMAAPRTWGLVLCGASAVWLANIATYRLAAAALGADLGLVPLALAFSVGSLAGSVSGTPGGAGTTESAALVPLVALGTPTDVALATILLARSTHYATALLVGGACAWGGLRAGASVPEMRPAAEAADAELRQQAE